jgi:hypothetical protein
MASWMDFTEIANTNSVLAVLLFLSAFLIPGFNRFARTRVRRRQRRVLEQLATAYDLPHGAIGTSDDGALAIDMPRGAGMDFFETEGGYRGARPAQVRAVRPDVRTWVSLSVGLSRAPGLVRVRPARSSEPLDGLLGPALSGGSGDAAFDQAFTVQSAPADLASTLLGVEIRRVLTRLPRSSESPRLTIDGTAMVLEWRGDPDPDLVRGVASALRTATRALAALSHG